MRNPWLIVAGDRRQPCPSRARAIDLAQQWSAADPGLPARVYRRKDTRLVAIVSSQDGEAIIEKLAGPRAHIPDTADCSARRIDLDLCKQGFSRREAFHRIIDILRDGRWEERCDHSSELQT